MYKKICNKCHQPSFSSCNTGTWLCPICNHDLTRIFSQDAESAKNIKQQLELLANKYSQKQNPVPIVNKSI
ncbi:MAG: hypothetical protein Q8898_17430 [Bacillota bacterium]|nr:hypothetical protein [Bacillota bacterium]